MTGLQPLLLGIPWMDPHWLLQNFHTEFVWISLIIVFIECGLLFPFLPGDTLLFSVGLFVATDELNLTSGPNIVGLLDACLAFIVAAFAGNVAGYEIGRAIGPPVRRGRQPAGRMRSSSPQRLAAMLAAAAPVAAAPSRGTAGRQSGAPRAGAVPPRRGR